ncbi:hypothetical protein E3T34_11780 [Cryobacterium sp. TMT1-62]|uniref:Uncharacterized protein n=1 Tax=Cryobacterium sandaracinum TaxID=1259247 RepID=A0ABY2JD51_9MICO|nr:MULTISPECIES: hypothetical protein [Cryobacterium]TFB57129.1 hypothetical protein E3N94_06685 [Cryobacterium sp. Sr3]TFB58678.1 hypothetical protein E3N86_13260 [Cryobacterium sp. Hz7]TFC33221.1 hypothetical protein E3O28_14570 [Cryobacterium sp. TMT2-14]TFC50890.1 hypothetical protein E3O47_07775 [Cryobacterium sp. TMT2-17-1]TFC70182.1 hypothetical protein E3O54_02975 [Cryobacterium sp. TMT2-4]
MDNIPWFAWIAIVGIIAGVTSSIVAAVLRSREKQAEFAEAADLRGLVEQSTASNQAVLDRLALLELRLASIERTLTDIP